MGLRHSWKDVDSDRQSSTSRSSKAKIGGLNSSWMLGRLIALDEGSDFDRAVKSLAFGINDLCATGSLFSDQSEGWVLFHKIAQLPKAIIARVEIGQQL
jgi:hypothetical protein